MKKIIPIILVVLVMACNRDSISPPTNVVTFSFSKKDQSGGRTTAGVNPAAILLSIVDGQGNLIFDNKKLSLVTFGQGYVSESVQLAKGNYRLTKFIVLNAADTAIYATPTEGSKLSAQVSDPLPINFTVAKNGNSQITPQVLAITQQDVPEDFGYVGFGFEVVNTIKVKVKVKLTVGDILYEDVDTRIIVTGYDSINSEKWKSELAYVGPLTNELAIKAGLHHYTFEIHKFGISDTQTITGQHLLANRADGPTPVTYPLGGTTAAKKLSYSIQYFELPDSLHPGNTMLAPQSKTVYEYNSAGKAAKLTHYTYVAEKKDFEVQAYTILNHVADRVSKVSRYYLDTTGQQRLFQEDTYQYLANGDVAKITENQAGEVNFTYSSTDSLITAAYRFSNGRGFQYYFFHNWKNNVKDKTTQGAEICSEGTYSYDKNINPLKHLGYVGFTLENYSINNKLTENHNYIACAFPQLIPESHQYEYDSEGYPKVAVTTYKNKRPYYHKGKVRYFYQ